MPYILSLNLHKYAWNYYNASSRVGVKNFPEFGFLPKHMSDYIPVFSVHYSDILSWFSGLINEWNLPAFLVSSTSIIIIDNSMIS